MKQLGIIVTVLLLTWTTEHLAAANAPTRNNLAILSYSLSHNLIQQITNGTLSRTQVEDIRQQYTLLLQGTESLLAYKLPHAATFPASITILTQARTEHETILTACQQALSTGAKEEKRDNTIKEIK